MDVFDKAIEAIKYQGWNDQSQDMSEAGESRLCILEAVAVACGYEPRQWAELYRRRTEVIVNLSRAVDIFMDENPDIPDSEKIRTHHPANKVFIFNDTYCKGGDQAVEVLEIAKGLVR